MKANMKIILNEQLSVRIEADIAGQELPATLNVCEFQAARDAISELISNGNDCLVTIAGQNQHKGRILRMSRSMNQVSGIISFT